MKELINDKRNGMMACDPCHAEKHSGAGWNEDAADLVPGKEFREMLRRGGKIY